MELSSQIIHNNLKAVFMTAGTAAPGQPGGAAGMKRGDIFVVMADARLVVADVVVTHPSAAAYVGAASRTAGAAAAVAERGKRGAFAALGEGAGYAFMALTTESYGRLGRRCRPWASSARWLRPAMGACRSRRL
jgi:hypothetical protein